MDYKAREVTWLSKVNGIICDEPTLVLNKGNKDTQEMIERLKGLLLKRTRIWWNRAFLVVKDLNLFARKLVLHKVHNRGMDSNNLEDRTPNQIEDDALMSLERLSEEQTEVGPSRMSIHSDDSTC
ncbi:uncharacterized protein [Phyllobates terribilis]|uniref:uncharacterized protein isoform X4 n=1 Tax=Phyllobates terribilis TaxID=111132 RepID=UPI003CCB6BD2